MSRVGVLPVAITAGVKAEVKAGEVIVTGKKGALKFSLPGGVNAKIADGKIVFEPTDKSDKKIKALWGLSRNMVKNMVKGVTDGFTKSLDLEGVGYRAAVQGKKLTLSLGYSHPVEYTIPEGIEIKCPKQTEIVITGFDIQKVGQVAAEIRQFRKPEPYLGKGVKYKGENIRRKEGKKK